MIKKIYELHKEIEIFQANNSKEIEMFRIKYLGKNGIINNLLKKIKHIPFKEKKIIGNSINILKKDIVQKINYIQSKLFNNDQNDSSYEDCTKPGILSNIGSRHPISIVKNRIIDIFNRIGFFTIEGPEIEDDWHNFSALNFPTYHPARDMQDTFFIKKNPDILLRTHTSSVQIRYMKEHKPPIRILSPGKVYRNESISSRSHCMFHQIEGLYIDKKVSFANLKQIIQYFKTAIFGKSNIRLRPSYFPFTEPSAEVDVHWTFKKKLKSHVTQHVKWIEIMGCGMVDPQVLKNVGINPEIFSGFAFGMGIERITLLLYQIDDIRLYFENDIRFLKQFQGEY